MSSLGDLGSRWTDTLSTVSVGSLTLMLPHISTTDPREIQLSIELKRIAGLFDTIESSGSAGGFILSILFLSLAYAVGSVVIQFGELLSLLRDYRHGRQRIRERLEKVRTNPALLPIYGSAYSSFRSLCGFGGLLALIAAGSLLTALTEQSLHSAMIALGSAFLAYMLCIWFARYSFNYLDWILFGELSE